MLAHTHFCDGTRREETYIDLMESFTPIASLLGGLLIGFASALLLVGNGRIAGISGITGGVLRFQRGDTLWRALFVAGLILGGFIAATLYPDTVAFDVPRSYAAVIVAGLLVGIGTQMGSGCTSGHGVCGLSRLSRRSAVAVFAFMATAAWVVWAVNELFGGAL